MRLHRRRGAGTNIHRHIYPKLNRNGDRHCDGYCNSYRDRNGLPCANALAFSVRVAKSLADAIRFAQSVGLSLRLADARALGWHDFRWRPGA